MELDFDWQAFKKLADRFHPDLDYSGQLTKSATKKIRRGEGDEYALEDSQVSGANTKISTSGHGPEFWVRFEAEASHSWDFKRRQMLLLRYQKIIEKNVRWLASSLKRL